VDWQRVPAQSGHEHEHVGHELLLWQTTDVCDEHVACTEDCEAKLHEELTEDLSCPAAFFEASLFSAEGLAVIFIVLFVTAVVTYFIVKRMKKQSSSSGHGALQLTAQQAPEGTGLAVTTHNPIHRA